MEPKHEFKKRPLWLRILLLISGTISLGLGILGIFLPVLPTTPFLLLTATCYANSSGRFYNWLLYRSYFGSYIRNYREKKGIPLKTKIFAISFLWITILMSAFVFVPIFWVKIILIIIAISVTIHLLKIKTL